MEIRNSGDTGDDDDGQQQQQQHKGTQSARVYADFRVAADAVGRIGILEDGRAMLVAADREVSPMSNVGVGIIKSKGRPMVRDHRIAYPVNYQKCQICPNSLLMGQSEPNDGLAATVKCVKESCDHCSLITYT